MTFRLAARAPLVTLGLLLGCRGAERENPDSTRALPPVFPASPVENTHWNRDAGPVMIAATGSGIDSAMVILPYATDSTIDSLQSTAASTSGMRFDLFRRS